MLLEWYMLLFMDYKVKFQVWVLQEVTHLFRLCRVPDTYV